MFDISHTFSSLTVKKLSTLRNSPVFWPTLFVCLLSTETGVPCNNGGTDRDAVWGRGTHLWAQETTCLCCGRHTLVGSGNRVFVLWGAHICGLKKPRVCVVGGTHLWAQETTCLCCGGHTPVGSGNHVFVLWAAHTCGLKKPRVCVVGGTHL